MENFIGLNIKYLCDKNKLSQGEFGDLFEVKQSTINTYVTGRSNPSVETIQRICAHFKITIDDFINVNLLGKNYLKETTLTQLQEPSAHYSIDSKKIIQTQDKTIKILEKQVTLLEEKIESLKEKEARAS